MVDDLNEKPEPAPVAPKAAASRGETAEAPPLADPPKAVRPELLSAKVRDLGLTIAGSPLEPLVQQLHRELREKGITFLPPVYLSDEWGVPEGVPIIAVPFYLAKPELAKLEEQITEDLEDEQQIAMYLRHEAGHAFNYAYELYRAKEWTDLFGPFSRPYIEDYVASPHSRQFVRHLPGWYAQMHPEEDFAETFAVWLAPDSNWREKYAGTGALPKLEYVDRVVREIGGREPLVQPKLIDEGELDVVLADYYARRASTKPADRISTFLDGDLRLCFGEGGEGPAVSELLKKHRAGMSHVISDMTGARYEIVRSLLVFVTERCEALGLRSDPSKLPTQIAHMTALVTGLSFNYVRTGDFLGIPQEGRGEKRL